MKATWFCIWLLLGALGLSAQVTSPTSGRSLPDLIKTCKPAVVGVGVVRTSKLPDEIGMPSLEVTGQQGQKGFLYLAGSGFIVTPDGVIVTAEHVVSKLPEGKILVWLPNGKVEPAKELVRSKEKDFAILQIQATGLPFLKFGSFADLEEGDNVIFIGYPFGEFRGITHTGMVSWKGKASDMGDSNVLQLNAIVNTGNSGGPLISIKTGEVVGIVKAKYGRLTPYLLGIKNGEIGMGVQMTGGGFDFQRFVKDMVGVADRHIQMGIGFAVSSEYAAPQVKSITGSK